MYPISQMFQELLKRPDREFLVKADVGAEEYDMRNIVDFSIDSTLIPDDNFTIGTVIMSKLVIRLRLKGEVAAGARIAPYIAFDTSGLTWNDATFSWLEADFPWAGGASDWLPLGEFYVDSQKKTNDVFEFVCLDKLIWSEQPYVSQLTYPATMQAVWEEICATLGYTFDSTVQINPTYTVQTKPQGYTMRQMMGYIAGANAASVRAGKDGQIQFKRFAAATVPDIEMKASDYIRAVETNPLKQFTRFVVTYDTELELAFEAGTGSADQTLHIENPLMTQTMVNNLHAVMNGFIYQPMEIDSRGYPHFDVGDVIAYEKYAGTSWLDSIFPWQDTHIPWNGMVGHNSLILAMVLQYKGGFRMTLDAPSNSEQQSNYVVEGPLGQAVKELNQTATKLGRSYFGVTTTREDGLVIEREDGVSKLMLNSDVMDWWVDGDRLLYLDALDRRLKFAGTLEGVDGTFSGTVSAAAIIGSTITGGTINGTTISGTNIYGSYIATGLGVYPFIEFSSTARMLAAYGTATRYIKMEANTANLGAPFLSFGFDGQETELAQLIGGFIINAKNGGRVDISGSQIRMVGPTRLQGASANLGNFTYWEAYGTEVSQVVDQLRLLLLYLRGMGILS